MRALGWLPLAAGLLTVLATNGEGKQPKGAKPDLIVADLKLVGDDLVLEVQNQGPGTVQKGTTVEVEVAGQVRTKVKDKTTGREKTVLKRVSVSVKVSVPEEVFAIETVKVPLAKLGVTDKKAFSPLVEVTLDTKKSLAEEREGNNSSTKQIDLVGNLVPPPRGDYKAGKELPDLVITDITQKGTYLVVHYENKGKGVTGADFLISMQSGKAKFAGNPSYRFAVPASGKAVESGGLTPGAIGLKKGVEAEVEVVIDPEDRVRESDEKNNTFKKKVTIK